MEKTRIKNYIMTLEDKLPTEDEVTDLLTAIR